MLSFWVCYQSHLNAPSPPPSTHIQTQTHRHTQTHIHTDTHKHTYTHLHAREDNLLECGFDDRAITRQEYVVDRVVECGGWVGEMSG